MLEVTEFRSEARKALEEYLTEPIEVLAAAQRTTSQDIPLSDLAQSLKGEWDAFEDELGVIRDQSPLDFT